MNDVPDDPAGSLNSSIGADDEVVFWERFFAGLAPLRDASFNLRDSVMSGPMGQVYDKGSEVTDKTLNFFSNRAGCRIDHIANPIKMIKTTRKINHSQSE